MFSSVSKKCYPYIYQILFIIFSLFPLQLFAKELSLKVFLDLALKNNLELKALQQEIKALELEREATKGAYFPRLKLEEFFYKSNIPAQVFVFKLNQEKITERDFQIKNFKDPGSRNNFETRLSLELPLWLGGKIQAQNKMVSAKLNSMQNFYQRKEEMILSQVYNAYLLALLSKESIKVSESSIKEAEEYLRLAKARYEAGTVLLSDVYRAEVYLAQALESLEKAKNYYEISKKNLELLVNTSLGDFDIEYLELPPQVEVSQIKREALFKRADLRALEEEIKSLKASSRAIIAENLPQFSAFASVNFNDKDMPFGSSGSGYLLGVGMTWAFDTGLTTYKKAQAEIKRVTALEEKYKYLKDIIYFEIDKAYTDYQIALAKLRSAKDRIKYAEEMVRILALRYEHGIAKMVDLLDAQTQLDLARFEHIQALKDLHQAYLEILLGGGRLKDSL